MDNLTPQSTVDSPPIAQQPEISSESPDIQRNPQNEDQNSSVDNSHQHSQESPNKDDSDPNKKPKKIVKKKKADKLFATEGVQIVIKKDRLTKGIRYYKVYFTESGKVTTHWIPEDKLKEKASPILESYQLLKAETNKNSKDQKESKKKENKKKEVKKRKKPETADKAGPPKKKKAKGAEALNADEEFQVNENENENENENDSRQPKKDRKIVKIFGLIKEKENKKPFFMVRFDDSKEHEKVTWNEMHRFHKLKLLRFYEKRINLNEPETSLPEGLNLPEKLFACVVKD
ncbi:hypothetical protein TRFO_15519 [Tritrichomonas foetus]|uniref:Chromo domain-containing protein n=1 Tax=Tritrichomonas foetus TaxID=1144522 RepID=A0A1J4KSY0_9EUKA|nr:hypothetical protein TRFO_15519 [Tritrichomonas foetus]|eukprot:OHT14218.1 hypothetical protein TRFO_15519 [Tritrichomonas foetus]